MDESDFNEAVEDTKRMRQHLNNISDKLSNLDNPVTDLVVFIRDANGKDTAYWMGDTIACQGACTMISDYISLRRHAKNP